MRVTISELLSSAKLIAMLRLNNPALADSDATRIPTRRSELISKEVQWQQLQQSLEKRICELEDSLEKGKTLNSSQRKTPNTDIEESTTEMYIIVQRTSLYIVLYNLHVLHKPH